MNRGSLTVVTWNVNSLRVRQEQLLAWLAQHQPDVVCLQEIKMETATFPALTFSQAGYQAVWIGRKTYNGVAMLVRQEHGPPTEVWTDWGERTPDPEARLVVATLPVLGVQVASVYVPNGQDVDSPKFGYKLDWLRRFQEYLDKHHKASQPLLILGDFNIAPDDRDVYDPPAWANTVICHPEVRKAWNGLLQWGLLDAVRLHTQEPGVYTYWDYRMRSFSRNLGLRIDHVLMSASLAARGVTTTVDRTARAVTQPSDHAPLITRIGL